MLILLFLLGLACASHLIELCSEKQLGDLQRELECGADPNEPDDSGRPVLDWAVQLGNAGAVKILFDYGANPDIYNPSTCESSLAKACRNGNVDIVRLFLERGADPDIEDLYDNETPVVAAVRFHRIGCVDLLVGAGADLQVRSREGYDLLHLACHEGSLDVIFRLIGLGFDPEAMDGRGEDCREVARRKRHDRVIRALDWHETYVQLAMGATDESSSLYSGLVPDALEMIKRKIMDLIYQ